MKKGLSVLLIAAALFGFYGGAVNLNDVLACKDYWEQKGEETTANFNKLEDGINQLKENEQAYLDGIDQLAEGEKTLADGEAAYAEGQKTLAQGEADYAAAPGKLADGKAKLDANTDSYKKGKAFKEVVDKAAKGLSNKGAFGIIQGLLSQAGVSGVPASYNDMEETLGNLDYLKQNVDNITGMNSEKAFQTAVASQDAATQKRLKANGVTSYAALKAAIAQADGGLASLKTLKKNVDDLTGKTEEELKDILVGKSEDLAKAGIEDYETLAEKELALKVGMKKIDKVAGDTKEMTEDQKKEYFVKASEDLEKAGITTYAALAQNEALLSAGKAKIDKIAGMSEGERQNAFVAENEALAAAGITTYAELEGALTAASTGKAKIDAIAGMTEAEMQNAFVKEAGISGIDSYAALEGKITALSGAKGQVDAVAATEQSRKETLAKGAGFESYAALEAAAAAYPENEDLQKAKTQIDTLAGNESAFKDYVVKNNADLPFDTYAELTGTLSALNTGKGKIDEQVGALAPLSAEQRKDALAKQNGFASYEELAGKVSQLSGGKDKIDGLAGMSADNLKNALVASNETLAAAGINDYATLAGKSAALTQGKAQVDTLSKLGGDNLKNALVASNEDLAAAGINDYATLTEKSTALSEGKKTVDEGAAFLDKANGDKALGFVYSTRSAEEKAALKAQGIDGTKYSALTNAIKSVGDTKDNLNALKAGTDGITGMNSDQALKTAVGTQDKATQQKLKNSGVTSYKALTSALASLNMLDGFTDKLTSQKGNSNGQTYKNIVNTLKNAGFGSMVGALPATYKELADALGTYEQGVRDYKQGLADYAAAPAKLADGRAKLADAEKQLADGRAQLADGRAKLAEYEDGEQQVRDGLATVMGTEPDGGLVSILDRRNGDDDFDNGDNHLELDEGLEAVEVGRGYQADSGVLVTKEITNRAIGTAAGLGAAALALLAAILSFLKKNKGAGVSALLSAAAGGAAVALGTSAGTEFSSIAGSLVGATPWVAFGILGGVALVHAIAHFASKAA
ncbi:MAG: hypothetical protein IJH90_10290 [Mogibacterium sp.]|nr:hypothetical protein [Mogibacterium sp.]